ncbi:MAG: hypothetical protein SFU56_05565 [Capsulimonadales bacterium]|nr:hypothetical protein [Capsulimonadales bacterium]
MPVLGPVASTFLVVFYILTSLILVILLVAAVYLVLRLNALLEKYEQKIDPLLQKADTVLTLTTEKVSSIGTKAEEILTQGEELTEMVHSRVDTTTYAVRRTVFTPLIGLNSVLAGLRRGAETFTRRQQETITQSVRTENPVPVPEIRPMVGQTPNLNGSETVMRAEDNGAESRQITLSSRTEKG